MQNTMVIGLSLFISFIKWNDAIIYLQHLRKHLIVGIAENKREPGVEFITWEVQSSLGRNSGISQMVKTRTLASVNVVILL